MLTWLLAGPFGRLLESSLPYHHLEVESTLHMVFKVLKAPATYLALFVIGIGLAAWWWRDRLAWLGHYLAGLGRLASNGFGFEAANQIVVRSVVNTAAWLVKFQTGQLNWNMVGILAGLILVLAWLVLGV
jgi:NADH-quinone oxidoreductase subunit L